MQIGDTVQFQDQRIAPWPEKPIGVIVDRREHTETWAGLSSWAIFSNGRVVWVLPAQIGRVIK